MVDGAGGAGDLRLGEDVEGGVVGVTAGAESCGGEDGFEFSGAYDCIDFWDVLPDLIAVALDETSGNDQALSFAAVFNAILHHLEDGVDGLLLGGIDEAAGVVAAFGNLDIGAGAWGGEDAWGGVVVEVFGECGGGSVPGCAGEAAGLFACVAFRAG